MRKTGMNLCAILFALCASALWAQANEGYILVGGEGGGNEHWYDTDRGKRISDEGPMPSGGSKAALYVPNRLLDLLDIFSIEIGFGLGMHGNFHATRAVQLGGGVTSVSRIGIDGRRPALSGNSKAELSAGPLNMEYYKRTNAFGLQREYRTATDLPWRYQKYQDYWGVGGEATILFIGLAGELHPVEAADFITGLGTFDLTQDDLPRRWTGNADRYFTPTEQARVSQVVIVPSRVIDEHIARLEGENRFGCYYHRRGSEFWLGKLGGVIAHAQDEKAADEFTRILDEQGFDLHREMLARLQQTALIELDWNVADIDEIRDAYADYSVIKSHRGQDIRRLPNYKGLAGWYGADAILDLRVWEWGLLNKGSGGTVYLDVEFKLTTQPGNEVLLDVRIDSLQHEKQGRPINDFRDPDMLKREALEACDIVYAKIKDLLVESR